MNAKETRGLDYPLDISDQPDAWGLSRYIPTKLLKQIDHVKVITVTEEEENLSSSYDNGDVD